MIVYIWRRKTNKKIVTLKQVVSIEWYTFEFEIRLKDGNILRYPSDDFKFTAYSY